jgi:2-methylaconitate cis-trans-isomerase PrpF
MLDRPYAEQNTVPFVLMRGGTSKALFFHAKDLPAVGEARDLLLKRAMGTPDVMQIDGLGGARLVTSKVAIIQRSERPGADVDYTFAQVDIERDLIGYEANCGNISSAVAPFAIDEGLVSPVEPITTVRIYNTNTDKMLTAKVFVANGRAQVLGDCAIAGVPGTGSEILMDYSDTIGAKTGRLLPSGQAVDTIHMEDGELLNVTICDAGNPCVFVSATDLQMSGSELPLSISANRILIDRIAEIQSKAGQLIGLWSDWKSVHHPGLPLAIIVAPPADYRDVQGEQQNASSMDLQCRLVFLGMCHDSLAGTGAMCTAAASQLPNSMVQQAVGPIQAKAETLRIAHPQGVMSVKVVSRKHPDPNQYRYSVLGLTRTARRLAAGHLYIPVNYCS